MTLADMPIDPSLQHDNWMLEAQRQIRERDAELYPKPMPQYPLKHTAKGLRSEMHVKD